jgi:hypothetical protein
VVAVPPSISLPTPQSRTLFPRTNYSDLQKQQQPTQSHGSLGLGKETETTDNCRRYERTLELHKHKLLIFGSQIQLSRFAAEKDAPSTQHQRSIVTTMVSLKRGHPKMRARPWISIIGRTPSQAPPARQSRVTYCRNVRFRTIMRLSIPTMALRLRRCRKQSQVCTLHPCHGP